MKQKWLYLFLGLAGAGCAAAGLSEEERGRHGAQSGMKLVNDGKARIREIEIDDYKKMVQSGEQHVLVDTREDSEWTAGHVKGAVHLGKGIIERDI